MSGPYEKDFPALSHMTATSHMWLLNFKLNHIELNFRSLVTLAIFQVLERYMQLGASILDSTNIEHFHYHKNFYWMTLLDQTPTKGQMPTSA